MRLADQLRTTTFLLTLRYMVLFFVSVTILIGLFNWAAIGYIEQEADAAINAEIIGLQEQFAQRGPAGLAQVIESRIQAYPDGDAIYLIADKDGKPLLGNLAAWPALTVVDEDLVTFQHTESDGQIVRVRARLFAPQPEVRMLIGRKVRALDQLTVLADRTLFWGLGITLALALTGGLLMSNNVLRRVGEFNMTSRRIMAGDLTQRVATTGTGDEFDELANNLNLMMDQIEALMSSIQHMSDNVAHDLRTPLTRLRNRLEELLATANGKQIEDVGACIEDADALLSTFASLLSIARIEAGTYDADRDPVDLTRGVQDAFDLYTALAEDKSISLTCSADDGIRVRGDRNLLFQAVTNLLDNAIKYTPAGGQVAISLTTNGGRPSLEVADSGPGIPADMRENVLQRFYRLDKSRSEPGAGLGLSLVFAIAQRHGVELRLEDNAPGLRVRLLFPEANETGNPAHGTPPQMATLDRETA
ncbi:MAG: ATP-binding protein [Gammaproteobacteria bacterium]